MTHSVSTHGSSSQGHSPSSHSSHEPKAGSPEPSLRFRRTLRSLRVSRQVLSEEMFEYAVFRERMRADRRGIPFVLLTFELLDDLSWAAVENLSVQLLERLRLTDELGWWQGELSLLLTDTDLDGAEMVGREIRRWAAERGIGLVYRLSRYPGKETDPSWGETGEDSHDDSHDDFSDPASYDGRDTESYQGHDAERRGVSKGVSSEKSFEGPDTSAQDMTHRFSRSPGVSKRVFDIVSASCGLVVLSPLIVGIALMIKLRSKGPVIFKQEREGRGGKIFTMYKFRTMVLNAEAMQADLQQFNQQDGPAFKIENDPRLIPGGRILRKTCLDEVPQLINVLLGQMSVVGPRPLPVGESQQCTPWQRRRLDVLPGMTCTWQAEAARLVTFDDWMRLDLRYAEHHTVLGDLRLLFRTIATLIRAKASV